MVSKGTEVSKGVIDDDFAFTEERRRKASMIAIKNGKEKWLKLLLFINQEENLFHPITSQMWKLLMGRCVHQRVDDRLGMEANPFSVLPHHKPHICVQKNRSLVKPAICSQCTTASVCMEYWPITPGETFSSHDSYYLPGSHVEKGILLRELKKPCGQRDPSGGGLFHGVAIGEADISRRSRGGPWGKVC
ncbi:hypothetical protein L484_017199 [Morus notabilis]|uniref:Uncharacterized protein n=1 Tax=Morus notabilis TaxID=981085 RepID=W9QVR3_9ROSA|nr:hypothetical protein L484_017199 [Morus notabilis]